MSHTCHIDDCERPARSRDLCELHYRRWLRNGDPLSVTSRRMSNEDIAAKMIAYVDRSGGPDACWPWLRGRSREGYGKVYWGNSRTQLAHRLALEIYRGEPVPRAMEVMHSCDNPPCCNPAHLSVGPHAANMKQMHERDRAARGIRNPRTKLTDEQVAVARQLASQGVLLRDLAALLGVSQGYVSRLVRGERRELAVGLAGQG